jgi:chromosome segregation ATPase
MRKTWTAAEETYIKENFEKSRKDLAEHLGVSLPAINSKIQKMKQFGQLGKPNLVKKEIPVKKDPTLVEAFDVIDEQEKEIQQLKKELDIKNKELKDYSESNKEHLHTISSLQGKITGTEKDGEGHERHLRELNTALRYREKHIEDLKKQLEDLNPYHEGLSETVPKSCFDKLTEKYQKLEVKYAEAQIEIEEYEELINEEENEVLHNDYFELKSQLKTHKQFLQIIEEKDTTISNLKNGAVLIDILGRDL